MKTDEQVIETLEDICKCTSSALDNMQHYFENKCCPTADEVNQFSTVDSKLRYLIAKLKSARANPPRVEGFPEAEVNAKWVEICKKYQYKGAVRAFELAHWMYDFMSKSIAGGSVNKTEPALTQPAPEERKGSAWLLEASGDGQRDSRVVFGGIEEIKRGMADMMYFGTYEEALKCEGVGGYLEHLEDVENNWSENGEVWEEQGEQCWFRVSKIHDIPAQSPTEPPREQVAELVGAMKSLINESSGLLHAHEAALSMDGGNTNMACLKKRIDEARLLLAPFAEKGGDQ